MLKCNILKLVRRGFFLIAFLTGMAQTLPLAAQTATTRITPEQAGEESSQSAAALGFDKVYFSKTDINTLLSGERVAGVRFYTAKVEEESTDQTIIAASVYADGRETGTYLRMDGYTGVPLTTEQARNDFQRSKMSGMTSLAARFTSSDLMNSVLGEGGDGIHVKPANGSLILVAAGLDENGSHDQGFAYIRHAEPCPPMCEENLLLRMD